LLRPSGFARAFGGVKPRSNPNGNGNGNGNGNDNDNDNGRGKGNGERQTAGPPPSAKDDN
jgi:hypothetical protein